MCYSCVHSDSVASRIARLEGHDEFKAKLHHAVWWAELVIIAMWKGVRGTIPIAKFVDLRLPMLKLVMPNTDLEKAQLACLSRPPLRAAC